MPFPSKSYNLSFRDAISFLQADANRVWLLCKPYQFRDCSGCFCLWESLYASNWNLTNPNHTHTHTLMTNRHKHTHTHLVNLTCNLVNLTLSFIKPTPLSFVSFILSPQYDLLATSERVINPHLWMSQTHSLVSTPHSTISISISKAATKHKPSKPLPLFLSIPPNYCTALFLDTIYRYYLHFSVNYGISLLVNMLTVGLYRLGKKNTKLFKCDFVSCLILIVCLSELCRLCRLSSF